jgi:excisionase family DNA binding protein
MKPAVILTAEEYESIINRIATLEKAYEILISQPRPPEWLTVKQAAERLKKHEDTVYKMASDGRLTVRKDGKSVMVSWKSIQDWNLKHTIIN